MKKIGEYVVYRKQVCKVVDILKNYLDDKDYYSLVPITDQSLCLKVMATDNNSYIRDLISKDEIEVIIKKIPEIEIITKDERSLEAEYKELLKNGTWEELIKIIKTTYLRNKTRIDSHKKVSDKDSYYFELAEKYLYNEFAIVLGMTYNETKNYIIEKLQGQEVENDIR